MEGKRIQNREDALLSMLDKKPVHSNIGTCTCAACNNSGNERSMVSYYGSEPTIISLNDSQGINVNPIFFWRKSYVDHLADKMDTVYGSPLVANCSSLLLNKTEHIDYLLDSNVTIGENTKVQRISAVNAVAKAVNDFGVPNVLGLPRVIGTVGSLFRFCAYRNKKWDKDKGITDLISGTKHPIILYSSGANDIMRAVGSNPAGIKEDLKDPAKREYIMKKVKDPRTIDNVIKAIEENFKTIYGINQKAAICALGTYVPKIMSDENMKIFGDLVTTFNMRLKELCKSYGVMFVDVSIIGEKNSLKGKNFHISSYGHELIAQAVADKLYDRAMGFERPQKIDESQMRPHSQDMEYGLINMASLTRKDRDEARGYITTMNTSHTIEAIRREEIAREHDMEQSVCEKAAMLAKKR